MSLNSHKAAEPRAARTNLSLAGKQRAQLIKTWPTVLLFCQRFAASSSGSLNAVRESVFQASRHPLSSALALLGQRRQASPSSVSLGSAGGCKHLLCFIKVSSLGGCTSFRYCAVLPNPSFKPSPNGVSRGPGRRYTVHFRQPGPRATPLVPA